MDQGRGVSAPRLEVLLKDGELGGTLETAQLPATKCACEKCRLPGPTQLCLWTGRPAVSHALQGVRSTDPGQPLGKR